MSKNKDSSGESLPIMRLFPNLVTLIGLCFGLFALKYAISGQWEMAVIFIIIAAFIDGVDGRLARMLNATSEFGAQLDSLADFFNFGVAPALLIYMWSLHTIKGFGWAVTLFFIISMALRLARFNCTSADEFADKEIEDRFFTGVPAPCGAGLALIPIALSFLLKDKFSKQPFEIDPVWVVVYMAVIALLLVSRIPTISIKKVKIRREFISLVTSIAALFVIAIIIEPWLFLPVAGVVYLATIPYSAISYYRLTRRKETSDQSSF
ncbi:MAG: CDP-diacylglycerol-serine O-phosphatidyltransferase [Rickettsiaceae bacterium]|jgi:CDP-diacylglycerol--serine O-phosphatidyltransferase|nr:CDP-diacylglycerol-serine O-phosphatidyltransferase [Rickettsiaceae bacterium]